MVDMPASHKEHGSRDARAVLSSSARRGQM
jgi:hypothetical protein